jgi:uncharacterized protein YnzC (UPF0291/DUF896 family)
MKTFSQYLTESEKTFDYRIKICGDVNAELLKMFKEKLKKFDPVKISDPKTTPVQAQPADFPGQTNQRVTIIDGSFRYPATPPQIEQMAELCGITADHVCVKDLHWSEGMDRELLGIEEENAATILGKEYPADSAEQKKLKKEYADGNQQVVRNSAEKATWTVAGGQTPPAETTNDLPQGVESPMSKVKRPPRPATGFQSQGKK